MTSPAGGQGASPALHADTGALTAVAAALELLVLDSRVPVPCLPSRPAFGSAPVAAELSAAAVVLVERTVEASALVDRLLAACVTALTRAVHVLDDDGASAAPTGPAR